MSCNLVCLDLLIIKSLHHTVKKALRPIDSQKKSTENRFCKKKINDDFSAQEEVNEFVWKQLATVTYCHAHLLMETREEFLCSFQGEASAI